jgi:GntR family transcriptional regulator
VATRRKALRTARHTVWAVSTLSQLTIDTNSATPPFEQVRTQIAAAVATGHLGAGTRLPTVRQLAADLGLAANTVARAYRELEADAVIATHGRRGTFVRSEVLDEPLARGSVAEGARAAAADYVRTTRRLGLSSQEALRLVENAWNQGELTATR